MSNNDPFKKMDLNFDPTVEAKVEPKNPTAAQAELDKQNNMQEQYAQRTEASSIAKQNQEAKVAEVEKLAANEYAMKQEQAILSEAKASQVNELDKTLEFVPQDGDMDIQVDEKKAAKKLEKKAYKHKRTAYYWIFICVLSIIFGITSIVGFTNNVLDFVSEITAEEINFWGATTTFFKAFLNSFEALLFIFFIIFSLAKFRENRKPWTQWWIDTEPIRIAEALKKEIEINNKNRSRANSLAIPYMPIVYTGTTNKEELEHFKKENATLTSLIKKEEQNRKTKAREAKANKK